MGWQFNEARPYCSAGQRGARAQVPFWGGGEPVIEEEPPRRNVLAWSVAKLPEGAQHVMVRTTCDGAFGTSSSWL